MARKRKKNDNSYVEPDLPITPMLDMSFQLLAFFVMTFKPTPTEAQIPLSLPKEEGGPSAAAPSITDDEPEEVVVQVTAAANGGVADITVRTGKAVADAEKIGADSKALFAKLQGLSKKVGKGSKLKLEAAESLNYQFVIKLLDECRRAGFEKVSPVLLNNTPAARP